MKNLIKFLICIFAIAFLGCSTQKSKDFKHLEKYFKEMHNFNISNEINKIVVISEGKGCPTCEISFAKATLQYSLDSTVFIATAQGKYLDIQPLMELEKNCYFDWQLNKEKYPEFSSSRVIYLKNNEIDTIIVINACEIIPQLEYIKNK